MKLRAAPTAIARIPCMLTTQDDQDNYIERTIA